MSKAVLKEVREAIKAEQYDVAIGKCEKLLQDDDKNYMAYLLIGAAYQSSNKIEAAKHLRKAVQYSPAEPTVALQGLSNCAPPKELPQIYAQLMELMPDRYVNYLEKLYALTSNVALAPLCLQQLQRLAQSNNHNEQRQQTLKQLARIWVKHDLPVSEAEEPMFKASLEVAIADTTLDLHLPCYKRYLKLLFKHKEIASLVQHACKLCVLTPADVYAFEWLCKIYCENYRNAEALTAAHWSELRAPIDVYAEQLLLLNENSGLALLVQAIALFERQQLVAARALLLRVLTVQPNYNVALELLARTQMQFGAFEVALSLWQQLDIVDELYAECLSHSSVVEQLRQALTMLEQLPQSQVTQNTKARCYFKLGQLTELNALPLTPMEKAEFLLAPNEALSLLQSSANTEDFDVLLLMGKLQLQLGKPADALTSILTATRLQPQRSECFHYLGKIYYAMQDIMRARKCFEKCINLNPLCEDAINTLSALYQQLGEEDLNIALLLNTLKHMKNENSKTIHYKLGLHYLSVNKWDDAIQSFRTAIKFDVTCIVYWESLGDAYAERGSYNSAIRVFQKILEFDADNVYAQLQIAIIKTTVRMYPEAIADFDKLLLVHPDYLPSLKGAAEAHIGLAYNMKLEQRYGRSKAHLQLAVNHLQRAFQTHSHLEMIWLWRLTANVFVQVALLPNSLAQLEVAGTLAKRDTETVHLERKELLQLAIRFYTCALKLRQNTFLWYELALCAYYSSKYLSADETTHLELATKACHMAIQEQNDRWQNWNLLGVINMHEANKNYALAQHCFVQALQLERKSYTTWTNLGVLYLKLGDIKLANQSFQRAQQSSPIYPNAWIGQAMIAEAIGEEEEALDLFRHCQQFELHAESTLGYAHWVCNMLLDVEKCQLPHYRRAIDHMYADVVALDGINWYIATEQQNASVSSLTFQGFLSARQQLHRAAVQAYKQAASKSAAGAQRDKINTNLGFLHLKLGEPIQAINAFNAVSQADFKPIIGLALAYFRAGQHQEAYSVYNSVLKSVAGSEDDKAALILVAMAAMVYASQGEADTKTILYQCILLKDSPIQALYSACALGILHNDSQLTETILSELKKYENTVEHCAHIAYLTAQYFLTIQQPRKGLNYLLSRVHIFPNCAELRKVLATYLLQHYASKRQYQVATSQIALSAIGVGHHSKGKKNSCIEDSKSLLVASRALEPVNKIRSLKLIQRAIHLYPQNVNAWHALQEAH